VEEVPGFDAGRDSLASALHEGEQRWRAVFEHSAVGIAISDVSGRLYETNRRFREMIGYSGGELRNMIFTDFTHPDDIGNDWGLFQDLLAGKRDHYRVEKRYVCKDSRVIWVDLQVSVLRGDHGQATRAIGIAEDITQRKQLEAFRSRFIAEAAHELRTPVAAINGFVQLLSKGDDAFSGEQKADLFDSIVRQSDRLRRLINDLLDLSRLDRGVSLDLEEVKVAATIDTVIEATPPPQGKNLHLEVPPDLVATADPLRLEQMLTNLLVNAYRHGGDDIKLEGRASDDEVIIRVTDDGPGLPEEVTERLFEPFVRGTDSPGGLGLGLALTARFAEACGGNLKYADDDEGSTFILSLHNA
jgi:PAS domain S-box-containing protein